MGRQLWLLRHGDAEAHDARPDAERRLTARGEGQARSAGLALQALGVAPAMVLTSPKVRARDTAALACQALGVDPVEHRPLAGGFAVGDALELLGAVGNGEALLLVGHEPDFSQLVHDLTGGQVDVKKGGVAAVRTAGPGGGELIVLLRPKELHAIAGAGATAEGAP